MENICKPTLPSPDFNKATKETVKHTPLFLTPSGMTLLPRPRQAPTMFGPRGSTVPGRYLPFQTARKQTLSKPRNEQPQFCEACEIELQSMEDFRRHKAQHQRCQVDGCNYRGHPSVMDKHVTILHTSGLFDKCRKLSTPEEIAAWREERRKKYPTVANTQMRQMAQEQRKKRGERLEQKDSRFGRRDDRLKMQRGSWAEHRKDKEVQKTPDEMKRNQKNIKRNKRRKKARTQVGPPNSRPKTKTESNQEGKVGSVATRFITTERTEIEAEVVTDGVPMFRGTTQLKNYRHQKLKKAEKNALTSLLGMYGSDDDENGSEGEGETAAASTSDSSIDEKVELEESNLPQTVQKIKVDEHTVQPLRENSPSKVNPSFVPSLVSNESESTNAAGTFGEAVTERTEFASDEASQTAKEMEGDEHTVQPLREDSPSEVNPSLVPSLVSNEPELTTAAETFSEAVIERTENASSDEAPQEAPIAKTSQMPDPLPRNEPPRKRQKTDTTVEESRPRPRPRVLQSGLNYHRRLRKQNTLLEKLLEADIRHERNVLLQCVRFVCENKFFGVGQSDK